MFLWHGGFFLQGHAYDVSTAAFFLYMVAFMDTTATIPTGAMAERWKWNAFVGWGLFCGAIYYPLFGAWTWGGGWLAKLGESASMGHGYVDFAGSGVVHMMGGVAGLAGAMVLGPRIGKYGADGKPRALAGHHIPMAMLGTFILLFGWFGFNAASTFAATDIRFAVVAVNTAIAAAFGAVIAMFWVMMRAEEARPGMMANGMLAGLVAITAPCAFVQPWAAALIGIIAGLIVVESVWFIEKRGVDDPVGAISVHGVCGACGVLAVGLFADGSYGVGWNGSLADDTKGVTGIFYGGSGGGQLAAQVDRRADDRHRDVRHRLRVLLDPEQGDEGWHPPDTARSSSRVWTFPRWVCWRTPTFYGSNPHVEMPDHDGLIELPNRFRSARRHLAETCMRRGSIVLPRRDRTTATRDASGDLVMPLRRRCRRAALAGAAGRGAAARAARRPHLLLVEPDAPPPAAARMHGRLDPAPGRRRRRASPADGARGPGRTASRRSRR